MIAVRDNDAKWERTCALCKGTFTLYSADPPPDRWRCTACTRQLDLFGNPNHQPTAQTLLDLPDRT